jgi:predicted dehydrogenase
VKQVLQNFRDGTLTVADVPAPGIGPGQLLVRLRASLISPGTERGTVDFARKSLAAKAMSRMDLVAKVVETARSDGIAETLNMVRSRLDAPAALGYSCAGEVVEIGANVGEFRVGYRVACAGQNYASHAEFVAVPKNLVVPIPEGVSFGEASYVTLGAIALQGVRQAEPALGEVVVVIGLGLLGQLTVQLLKANGCTVLASDLAPERCALARELGADIACLPGELANAVAAGTAGHGADAVIITASSKSDDPVRQAAEVSRRKGRIVVVGAVGMNLPREPFYVRELELRLSMSYGPGRYDPQYEEAGQDYPYAYVRWTEKRNMEAFVHLLREKRIDVEKLTTHRFPIERAAEAYELVTGGEAGALGVLLEYASQASPETARKILLPPRHAAVAPAPTLALIGVGNHVTDRLLPALARQDGISLTGICSATGKTAARVAAKLGAKFATTDFREVLNDPQTQGIIIGTRHNLHAEIVAAALRKGKHVFVEKPLCLTDAELADLADAYVGSAGATLFVGYNRRYSEHVAEVMRYFASRRAPLAMVYRVNAGPLPAGHWALDETIGGGRIIGECCHFVDLLQTIAGSRIEAIFAASPVRNGAPLGANEAVITLEFADGSVGTIIYSAAGDKRLGKERCEIFCEQASVVIDDFRRTEFYRRGKRRIFKTRLQDKGFIREIAAFVASLKDPGAARQRFEDLHAVSQATFRAVESTKTGQRYRLASSPVVS